MSVVNQMLKDIERRRGELGGSRGEPFAGLRSSTPGRRPSPLFWLGGVAAVAALLLVVLLAWHQLQSPKPAGPVVLQPAEQSPPPTVAPVVVAVIPDVAEPQTVVAAPRSPRVTALEVGRVDRTTRLVAELDRPASITLERTASRTLLLAIEGAELTALPPAPGASALIESIVTREHEGRLEIELALAEAVEFNHHRLAADAEHGERIVIDLYRRQPAKAKVEVEPTPVPPVKAAASPKAAAEVVAEQVAAKPAAKPKGAAKMEKHEVVLTPQERAAERYTAAQAALRERDAASAERLLREVLAAQPDHHPAREQLLQLLIGAGRSEEARRLVAAGLDLAPNHLPFVEVEARLLVAAGSVKQALEWLQASAPARLETDPDYFALMAALAQQLKRHAEAAGFYRRLVGYDPAKGVWWMGLAISQEALAERSAALEAYRNALASGNLPAGVVRYVQGRIEALK